MSLTEELCLKTSRQQSPVHTMEHPSERLETASPNHQGTPGHVTPSGSLRSQTPSYNEVGFVSCFKSSRHKLVFWFLFFKKETSTCIEIVLVAECVLQIMASSKPAGEGWPAKQSDATSLTNHSQRSSPVLPRHEAGEKASADRRISWHDSPIEVSTQSDKLRPKLQGSNLLKLVHKKHEFQGLILVADV